MQIRPTEMTKFKSKPLLLLEWVLLAVCLGSTAAYVVLGGDVVVQPAGEPASLLGKLYGVSAAGVLLFVLVIWLVCSLWRGRFSYYFTGIEWGLLLLCAGSVVGIMVAADKRAAINCFAETVAPICMAVFLIQVLTCRRRINVVLGVITAMGVVTAIYCTCQFLWLNDMGIEQYENNPQALLDTLNIQQGSFRQMLFEKSLYSRDVRGFFTTGNSAGSFLVLALSAAVVVLLDKVRSYRQNSARFYELLSRGAAAGIIGFGLLVTHSKGAIAGLVITAVMLAGYVFLGGRAVIHKKKILVFALICIIALAFAVVVYGVTYDRLPGGNSMLVRWQYWRAAGQMWLDQGLTGVGPGNFVHFYPHYKSAAAPETVADPHNFLLSILAQFGPLGVAGFLSAIAAVFYRVIFLRPVQPAGDISSGRFENVSAAVLFCAMAGFLVHNCIDFAIFEGPILTTFWAVGACAVGMTLIRDRQTPTVARVAISVKAVTTAAAAAIVFLFAAYVMFPSVKTTVKIRQALKAQLKGQSQWAQKLLAEAAEDDRFSNTALFLGGQFYMDSFYSRGTAGTELLLNAAERFRQAHELNNADYKSLEKLADVYAMLAVVDDQQSRTEWLTKAMESANLAVERFGGCGRLRVKLAQAAEQLERLEIALEQYKKAVEIEDSYRRQFAIMYPEREMFSRLGQQTYEFSKQRIETLSEQ